MVKLSPNLTLPSLLRRLSAVIGYTYQAAVFFITIVQLACTFAITFLSSQPMSLRYAH